MIRTITAGLFCCALTGHLKGFVQLYSGYGENLIDMENYNNRIGIGLALTDWL